MASLLSRPAFNVFLAVSIVFLGCGLNSLVIEAIIKIDPKSGTLVAIFQFLLVALIEGFSSQIDYKTMTLKPMKLPLKFHAALTLLFFLASLANNIAYYYNISQPFHITFRSSSLAGSLLVGAFFFGKNYPFSQWCGVFLITAGVLYVTMVNSNYIHFFSGECCGSSVGAQTVVQDPTVFVPAQATGLIMLTFSVVSIAVLGHLQDRLKKIYGSDWRENIFYTHLISTVSAVFFYSDVQQTISLWNTDWLIYSFVGVGIPVMWALTFLNGLTQYICMCGVQMLAFYSDPVTLNLVVTLRKFVSLVASIVFFKNIFGLDHFAGTTLVFIGTVIYYVGFGKLDCFPQSPQLLQIVTIPPISRPE